MAIEPISAISGNSPILVIDRARDLTRAVVRVVDATEVIGDNSIRGLPSSFIENQEESFIAAPSAGPLTRSFVSDDLLVASLGETSSEFSNSISSEQFPTASIRSQIPYDRLVLYGTLYIDVIV